MNKKPKDCICGFPKINYQSDTRHGEWCAAHKRLSAKHTKKAKITFEENCEKTKDAYGRWVAGIGPKPDGI